MIKCDTYALERHALERLIDCQENIDIKSITFPEIKNSNENHYEVFGSSAVIQITGIILREVPWYFELFDIPATSTEDVREQLFAASVDPQIENINLLFDSPGGTVTDVQELAEDIYEAGKEKHIESFIAGQCCSAAYWLASQTSKITATATSAIGSIGCYAVIRDNSELYEKNGIKSHLISSGEHKGMFADGVKINDESLKIYSEQINGIADLFKADVSRGRGISAEDLAPLATGRCFIGSTAVQNKLIDAIGRIENVLFNHKGDLEMKIFGKKKEEAANPKADSQQTENENREDTTSENETAPADAKELISVFGSEFGAKAIEADMTMAEAKDAYIEHLSEEVSKLVASTEELKASHEAEVTELNKRIEALNAATGEDEPASSSDAESNPEADAKAKKIESLVAQGYSEAQAKIIADTKLKK